LQGGDHLSIARVRGQALVQYALEVHNVCKRFSEQIAIADIDLAVAPGCVHGLLGPNGAGKTTLLRILLGLVRRDAGTVHLLGRSMEFGQPIPDGVAGFVESPAFYSYLTGRHNLTLLARLDRHKETPNLAVDEVIERVGLTSHAAVAVANYSAGMRQRLGLAAALLRSPRLLLLDEPTSSLDPAAAVEVRALVRSIARTGATVLLSSHDMPEVEQLCSSLTFVRAGRVVYAGSVDGLRALAPGAVHIMRTSDDRRALQIASQVKGITVEAAPGGTSLELAAPGNLLDEYVLALAASGIAVRALEPRMRSLEELFFQLARGSLNNGSVSGPHPAPRVVS
jgi:ABC-2 type transport system ATP-binding protein